MVGTGYVGLVTGACLSDFGHEVVCIDKDEAKIAALGRAEIPIFEPGLGEIVANNLSAGRLSFTSDLGAGVRGAQAIFIAVGTPTTPGEERADLSYVFAAARQIGAALDGYAVIVTKSTVPVGTGDAIARVIAEVSPSARFSMVSNPEFLREGSAIKDFKLPDRIVIGVDDEEARHVMSDIYRPLYLNQGPVMFTGRRTSELINIRGQRSILAMKVRRSHQRNQQSVRGGWGGCAGSGAGHRAGQSDRTEVSERRAGVWRLVFPQRHAGSGQDGAGR